MEIRTNEQIFDFVLKIAEYYKIENCSNYDFYSRNELIEKIKEKNENAAKYLKEFLSESSMYQLIKHDMEMKIKAPEIWNEQIEYRKRKVELLLQNLLEEVRLSQC
ncbi:MAG: hypothetical protein JXR58_03350 [Bacteroidales bacterium]|nr:hypothetical protein [Bacteroidales bacterium]